MEKGRERNRVLNFDIVCSKCLVRMSILRIFIICGDNLEGVFMFEDFIISFKEKYYDYWDWVGFCIIRYVN